MTDQETITEYVERRGITLTVEEGPTLATEDGWERNAYVVTLRLRTGEALTTDYKMGTAHTRPPTADEVLDALLSDSEAGAESFEDFCANFGYDTDSRRAFATWEACSAMRLRVTGWLGVVEFFDVLPSVERL